MDSLILLFLCLFLGILIRRFPNFPPNTHTVLNQYILFIALPAMALFYLPEIQLSWSLIFPALIAWLGFILAYIIFKSLGKYFGWSKKLIGCLVLTAGLGNTSFVGIPIISALYGEEGIKTLIIVDLPGTFVVLSTLGVITATAFSSGQPNPKTIAKQIFKFPPFLAFLVGVFMLMLDLHFPSDLKSVWGKLAATVSPIALVSVGFQLRIEKESKHWSFLIMGLAYQLILFPLIIFLLYIVGFKLDGTMAKVCVVEAAMAPMITGAILAVTYGLKPRLANMMVGIGIPVSFITIAGWYYFLEWYF